jgi:hypothetical protein
MSSIRELVNLSTFRIKQYFKLWLQDPRLFFLYVLGRFEFARRVMPLLFKRNSTSSNHENHKKMCDSPYFGEYKKEHVLKAIEEDGFYSGFNLPPHLVQEMRAIATQTYLLANGDPENKFFLADRKKKEREWSKTILTGECMQSVLNCSQIEKITQDSYILDIAAKYLGYQPVPIGNRLFWSFATRATSAERMPFAQVLFHYDMYDYRALNFFFYLTKVDLNSGAHICVRGTHRKKKISHKMSLFLRKNDEEIFEGYGKENVVKLCGEAGFGFIEDPYCFHRAMPPTQCDRLMLMITFGSGHVKRKVYGRNNSNLSN